MLQVLEKVTCGTSNGEPLLSGIPSKLPKLTSEIFTLILVAVPVLLVIMGTIDLFKGITADKEDEMVKGRKLFIKRLITGSLVFFLFTITKFVISIVDNKSNSARILNCVDCFINNKNCQNNKGKWDCYLPYNGESYHLIYDGIGSNTTLTTSSSMNYIIKSDFVPTEISQCPSTDEYELIRETNILDEEYWRIIKK